MTKCILAIWDYVITQIIIANEYRMSCTILDISAILHRWVNLIITATLKVGSTFTNKETKTQVKQLTHHHTATKW